MESSDESEKHQIVKVELHRSFLMSGPFPEGWDDVFGFEERTREPSKSELEQYSFRIVMSGMQEEDDDTDAIHPTFRSLKPKPILRGVAFQASSETALLHWRDPQVPIIIGQRGWLLVGWIIDDELSDELVLEALLERTRLVSAMLGISVYFRFKESGCIVQRLSK